MVRMMALRVRFLVAALAAFSIVAQPAAAQVEILEPPKIDPAKLTPEQLAQQFSMEWSNVSVSAQLNLKNQTTTRSINISGELRLEDEENVLGVCSQISAVKAIAGDGRELIAKPEGAAAAPQQINRHYSMPHQMPNQAPWFGKRRIHLGLGIQVGEGPCPDSLKQVTADFYVLIGRLKLKELRLEENDDWLQLGEGLEVRFKKCEMEGNVVKYQLEGRGPEVQPHFRGWQQVLPKVAIARAAFLDENGVEHSVGGSEFFSPNTNGSASFGNAAELVKMRFYVATDIREIAVPIEIKDLKLPTFDGE